MAALSSQEPSWVGSAPPEGRCDGCDNLQSKCACNCACGLVKRSECTGKCDGVCAGERRDCGAVNLNPTGEDAEWFCERCAEFHKRDLLPPDTDCKRRNLISEFAAGINPDNLNEQAQNLAAAFHKFAKEFSGGMADLRAADTQEKAVAALRRIRKAQEIGEGADNIATSISSLWDLDEDKVADFIGKFACEAMWRKTTGMLSPDIDGRDKKCVDCNNAAIRGQQFCAICNFKEEVSHD